MLNLVWNLQLFAEEGEGVEGAIDTEPTPNDTDVIPGDVAQDSDVKTDESDDVDQNGTDNPETNRVSFDELIKGDYKDDFKKATSNLIRKRVKGMQSKVDELSASQETLKPMMLTLANKYQLNPEDPEFNEKISEAVMNDRDIYEGRAMDAGLDSETYMKLQQMEVSNQLQDAQLKAIEEEQHMKEQYARHAQEAEKLKETYPDFDLITEIKENQDFAYLIDLGVPVENAFHAVHWEELQAREAKAIANVASKQVVQNVMANKQRPQENGLQQQPGNQIGTRIKSLSREELDELNAKALRGEDVDLKEYSI